ncbi:uncharacterized protein N7459_007710 [Penicillium hispanicum]|uniref:uncharacterized protein n=1 Tax=Penicillium hispanicum TaxID=1080232 RepID=UPI002541F1BF|nr:uncharacterized protein N7459_007710 [Penicillium hispanicum]KAJ5578746.1 hypothetical protein N7459_007710 [Penicillium hispanicum]
MTRYYNRAQMAKPLDKPCERDHCHTTTTRMRELGIWTLLVKATGSEVYLADAPKYGWAVRAWWIRQIESSAYSWQFEIDVSP